MCNAARNSSIAVRNEGVALAAYSVPCEPEVQLR